MQSDTLMFSATCKTLNSITEQEKRRVQISLKRDTVRSLCLKKSRVFHSLNVSYCALLHKTKALTQEDK